ncbi:MAG TPA: SDR family oxidoreductase [Candidatus Limnocylindrales bacterium]|nr:SDR family oxidoreductase [Candidatus Limnocylindrales bacterium]
MTLLKGQVAIVTGGGRGLGRAIAQTLASLGASVVVASRNAPELDEVVKLIRKAGGHALAQTADVSDERQVEELVLAAERWVGPTTILVNNAGQIDPLATLARSDPALWLRNISINIGGTYMPTRAILPGMLERGAGRIVNITSTSATRPARGWTAYSTAKAGVVQMTRSLALEVEGTGVTVCAYNPGPLDTEMHERTRGRAGQDARSEEFHQAHSEGRLRDSKSAARDVAYLTLPATERNGQTLQYDDADLARAVEAALPA